jgi:hypothetical protein
MRLMKAQGEAIARKLFVIGVSPAVVGVCSKDR